MKKPDFIIIGAAKCGTTSLYEHMLQNENIFMSSPKEPEFFARDDIYNKGTEWYLKLFSGAEPHQVCGEASTLYSLMNQFPCTAERMAALVPHSKIIYMLRNPIKRAYSYYQQLMKNFQRSYKTSDVPVSFESLLFGEEAGFLFSKKYLAKFDQHLRFSPELALDGGMYMDHLNCYLKFYDEKNIKTIIFEDMLASPERCLLDVYQFINVECGNLSLSESNISNDYYKSKATELIIAKWKENPLVLSALNLSPRKLRAYLRNKVENHVTENEIADVRPQPMSPKAEKYLKEYYIKPTQDLSEYLGRDLNKFWDV